MNQSADPCNDFFEYACGGWVHDNPLPEFETVHQVFGQMWAQLSESVAIIIEDSTQYIMGGISKANQMYESCINPNTEQNVRKPFLEDVAKRAKGHGMPVLSDSDSGVRNAWDASQCSKSEMADLLQNSHRLTFNKTTEPMTPFFYINVFQKYLQLSPLPGARNSSITFDGNYTLFLKLLNASTKLITETEVQKDIEKLLDGTPTNPVQQTDITEIIRFLSNFSSILNSTKTDPTAIKMDLITLKDIKEWFSFLDWDKYLTAIMPTEMVNFVNDDMRLVVYGIETETKMRELNAYLLHIAEQDCRTLHNFVGYKSIEWLLWTMDLDWPADSKKRFCNQRIQKGHLNQLVGALYVQNMFSAETRHDAEAMVANIRDAVTGMIESNEWLDKETKRKALEKAGAMRQDVGFPGATLDEYKLLLEKYYADLPFDSTLPYYKMVKSMNTWALKKSMNNLVDPIGDGGLWNPAFYNAQYFPLENKMRIFGALISPPNFRFKGPASLNYGGIGMIIGHEVSHGFDNHGRKYDKNGQRSNWWTKLSENKFINRSICFTDQYHNIDTDYGNVTLNGIKTLGENIADAGGIKAAFLAYRKYIDTTRKGIEESRLPGLMHLSHDQLLFLSATINSCGVFDKKGLLKNIKENDHAIIKYRIFMQMTNSKEPFISKTIAKRVH